MLSTALRQEHDGLRELISRLKSGLAEAPVGREPLAASVRPLLVALFQHEAGEAGLVTERFAAEHLTLRSLARDLQIVVEDGQLYTVEHLARLASALADALLAHMDGEEAGDRH